MPSAMAPEDTMTISRPACPSAAIWRHQLPIASASTPRPSFVTRLEPTLTTMRRAVRSSSLTADTSPTAYERVVDRLLASPHYGERLAERWLDAARYTDSHGYQTDGERQMWRWRDWVIDAFNRNLPYDQFTIEQIAGDLLPNATPEQIVATAFHRNTMTNTEGGTDDEEYRVAAVKDRIATTGQVWMGLTVGCAQCHTHKFDPIPHEEYYKFFALLNKADLPRQLSDETAQALWPGAPLVATSTITGNGLAALEGQIAALALGGTAQAGDVLVSSARHKDALRRGLEHIQAAEVTLSAPPSAGLDPYTAALPDSVQQALTRRYAELFGVYMKYRDVIERVTFWGVTDGDSWLNGWPVRGRTSYPLLFDRAGQPKPAFDAVIRMARPEPPVP